MAESDHVPFLTRVKWLLFGAPRDLKDGSIYRHLSLIAFLAWVGLGADGLSSSAYGPEEAYKALHGHTYLAVALAAMMALTVMVISAAYSRIIEKFPHGGGGYVVATKLLGEKAGVVAGSALLVDYVLTITISIAAAGDALFSFLPPHWQIYKLFGAVPMKLVMESIIILFLTGLNLRGVRESILVLTPIFILFLITHAILIGGAVIGHAGELPATAATIREGFAAGKSSLGLGGMLLLFVHAYSLGGGTYTGIEAVSNGMSIMREPRVKTARRTMIYMSLSLAVTASGLLLCYLLWDVHPVPGKTLNAVLVERFTETWTYARPFVIAVLVTEGALLVVAAQAGLMGGPRVLASMALDSWVPRRFGALSERLTTRNGIVLMGVASLVALLYTKGDVSHIVVMYSINVFLTFLLSMFGMLKATVAEPREVRKTSDLLLFLLGLLLCATILVITVWQKFFLGGYMTLIVTGAVIALCFVIRRHYSTVATKLGKLYERLAHLPPVENPATGEPDDQEPVAVVLVGGFGGLGIHTFMSAFRAFPNHFKGVVFVSVGVIDSREFKGEGTVEALKQSVESTLSRYVAMCRSQGMAATSRLAIGTDAVEEGEQLCLGVAKEFPKSTFFAGKVLFQKERWYQAILHNETAFSIQKRLQWAGKVVVVVPARVT